LKIYAEGTRIRVDLDGRTMEPVSGQLLLDFGQSELAKLLEFPTLSKQAQETVSLRKKRLEAEMLFEKALSMEQTGAPIEEIMEIYEYALSLDPNSTGALVNLGTIHFNARDHRKAEEYYLKAIEIDPEYALAHFNLANLYDERREPASALKHYLAAIKLNPRYADAHYNIALLYQTTGQTMRAVQHWQTYLKIDPSSSWATIARRELDKLKSATVLQGGA
jgi:tetratricopeptide (TPR) repeat protein